MMFSAFQKKLTQLLGPLRIITSGKTATALEVNSQSRNTADLMDLKVDNVSKFKVDNLGQIYPNNSIWLAGTDNTGYYNNTGARIRCDSGFFSYEQTGVEKVWFRNGYGVRLAYDYSICWTATSTSGITDTYIGRDAVGVFSIPTTRLYGKKTSDTAYQRMGIYATAVQSLTATGASVSTTTLIIPKYSQLIGVTTRVMTALGTTNGTTGYLVGDGTDADLWGAMTGTAIGTSSDARDYTAINALGPSGVDRTVTLTAVGGNFNGAGVIDVCAFYLRAEAD